MAFAMARRFGLLLLAVGCAFALPRASLAKTAKSEARHLLGVGAAKYKAHDYKAALEAFQQAYAAYPSSKIIFNIAQAYKALDQADLAADAFTEFLQKSAADVKLDERRIKEARGALRELGPAVIQVRVELSPSTAELTLDGERNVHPSFYMKHAGDDDLLASHHLTATAPGFAPGGVDFTLASVQVLNKSNRGVALTLQPQAAVVQKSIAIEKKGEATLVPVPESAKPATLQPLVLAPTTPDPRAAETASTAEKPVPNVTPTAAELAQIQKSSAPGALELTASPPHGRHTASFVAWGVGAAFAAGATIVGVIALTQNHTAPGHTKAKIADGLWGATAVAAITGGVLWFAAPGDAGSGGEVGVAGRF